MKIMTLKKLSIALLCSTSIALTACGDSNDATPAPTPAPQDQAHDTATWHIAFSSIANDATTRTTLEIQGVWDSNFGGLETFTDTAWITSFGHASLVGYNNTVNMAILLTPPDAAYNPNTYSRIIWTNIVDDAFYYCTTDYGLPTEAAAMAANTPANADNPAVSGCGQFGWTRLSLHHPIEISGIWTTSSGGQEMINDIAWTTPDGSSTVASFDNAHNVAILHAGANAAHNPNTYSRVVWTDIVDGSFYYCITDAGLPTQDEAEHASTPTDATNPSVSGCGASPWTRLTTH